MIYVENSGRLGNQLFRYAFARAMQVKRGDTIVYHFSPRQMDYDDSWSNQLQYFNITKEITFDYSAVKYYKSKTSFAQKCILLPYLILRRLFESDYTLLALYQSVCMPFLNKNGLYLQSNGYIPAGPCNRKDIIINGLYESPAYFEDIREILLREITPKLPLLEENKELYDIILNTESVCISVRRGDFLSEQFSARFNVCTEKYFLTAISKMREIHPGCVFIFFSDDISWCKKTFGEKMRECFFESGNDPIWEKLRLMYSCKHFIVSNSTFSWWAQYLGKHEYKTVISPERWRNKTNFHSPLIEPHFITLPVD